MARILCAWEFGGDLGHIRTLIPVARALRAAGHEVQIAFRDATRLEVAAAEGFEGYPAPLLRPPPLVNPAPLNFADVLLNLGYGDTAALSGAIRGWTSLFQLLGTEAVVADYAPTCLLAARERGLRRAAVGNGFSTPAIRDPLPALRPSRGTGDEELRALDRRLLDSVAAAIGRAISLRDALEADVQLLTTFPALDPHGPREIEYAGPVDAASDGVNIEWPATTSLPRVCAYLQPRDSRFGPMVQALRNGAFEALVVAPGFPEAEARAASSPTCRVVPDFVKLAPLLQGAQLCVFHGGSGVAALALSAGVPMVVLPLHLEHTLIANRIERAGCGTTLPLDLDPAGIEAFLAAAVAEAPQRERSREIARGVSGSTPADALARVTRRIAAMLDS